MQIGIVVGGELAGIEAVARRAEDTGFESIWVAETARTAFISATPGSPSLIGTSSGNCAAPAFDSGVGHGAS